MLNNCFYFNLYVDEIISGSVGTVVVGAGIGTPNIEQGISNDEVLRMVVNGIEAESCKVVRE